MKRIFSSWVIFIFILRVYVFILTSPHQWRSCYALEIGKREVPGSNPGRACRPSRLDFSVIFFEIRLNMGKDPLERPATEAVYP